MTLTANDAKSQLEGLIAADASVRPYLESFWTLAAMYDGGKQWGYAHPSGPGMQVRQLKSIVDPRREDVRVVMDKTHEMTRQMRSMLTPSMIACNLEPVADAPSGRIVANAGQVFLERLLGKMDALSILRDRDNPRCVFGNMFIRRTLAANGPAMEVDPKNGLRIRNFSIGWELVYPWETVREVGAMSLRPYRDESMFCHAKPRSAAWVKRHFGTTPKDTVPVGKLLDYHDQMRKAGSVGGGSSQDDKTPAVMMYECYFRDGDTGTWDWCLMAYRTDSNPKSPLQVLPGGFFKNPFHGLPFEMFRYDPQPTSAWARGIPHILMAGQQITNLAWTWLCRTMQAGVGKVMIEKGTIEDPSRALDNRLDRPLVWQRSTTYPAMSGPPTRLSPPQISPASMEIISAAPNWMAQALNLSDVQRGVVSKRGESGDAIRLRMDAANSTVEEIRQDDDGALSRLLYGTLVDAVTHSRVDQIAKMVGGAIPPEHVLALKRQPIEDVIASCRPLPSMTRPTNPTEARDSFIGLSTAQIIDPETALWEMGLQGGVWAKTAMRESRRKQQTEIEQILSGSESPPSLGDHHEYHLRTIQEFVDSPQWLTVPRDAQDRLLEHWALHKQSIAVLSGQVSEPEPAAGQPSPSGEAVRAAAGTSPLAMGADVQVA